MRLDLWHLYPQDMNIYGDRGNVIALVQRARWRGIDVEHLFTHRWALDQAEEAYKLFDTQTTGKGVFLM